TVRLCDMLDRLRGQFDWVFLDAPPVVGISDAAILASKVDAVLLVVQHRSYPREVPIRAKQIIESVGGNLLGVVFNNINLTRDPYYYHHYYRYYSDAYGYGRKGPPGARLAKTDGQIPGKTDGEAGKDLRA
ncbi:MAG: capsular biosynthesis protein, partial [Kiritimatiellia bacterium]